MPIIIIFGNKPNWCKFFSYMFISVLYMFRAAMYLSSGELILSMRHLVYVTRCRWPSGMQVEMSFIPTCVPDWPKHVENRNKHIRENCALNWFIYEDRHCTCNIEPLSRNHCCRGKARIITDSECVYAALGIQHTKCTRSILLSSLACLAVLYFSTLSHKWHYFRWGGGNYLT